MSQENIGARETGAINQQRHHYNYFDQNTNTNSCVIYNILIYSYYNTKS